jgi:hypothetical protein
MPEALKSIAQTDLTTTSLTTVYTVPASTSVALSTIAVTNRHTSLSCTYNLAHSPAGASVANAHYFAYGETLAASTSVYLTIGMTMATTDVLRAQAGTANQLSINLWGIEKT